MTRTSRLTIASVLALAVGCAVPSANRASSAPAALVIQEQGSFAVGGTVVTAPGTFDPIAQGAYNPAGADARGQTLHGDHTYVFYQVPVNARRLPLVFWHGHGQSGKTWETTPDGREGFQTIFLRRRYPVYVLDQPRRGRAARSTQPAGAVASLSRDGEAVAGCGEQARRRRYARGPAGARHPRQHALPDVRSEQPPDRGPCVAVPGAEAGLKTTVPH